jgi:hypothetical protein
MHTSYNFADAQQLLIKPFDRLRFVLTFVLTVGLSEVIAYWICSLPQFLNNLSERSPIQYGIVTGLIIGAFIGTAQWLVLRKYAPDWKWILIEVVSSPIAITIQAIFKMLIDSLLFDPSSMYSRKVEVVFPIVFFVVTNAWILIYGYLQWYIFRPYITKARWLIFIPFLAMRIWGFLDGLEFLTHGLLKFNSDVLLLTVMSATQAISYCILKKRILGQHPTLQTSLTLAPDLCNYWDIQRLKVNLRDRISRIVGGRAKRIDWTTDLPCWR